MRSGHERRNGHRMKRLTIVAVAVASAAAFSAPTPATPGTAGPAPATRAASPALLTTVLEPLVLEGDRVVAGRPQITTVIDAPGFDRTALDTVAPATASTTGRAVAAGPTPKIPTAAQRKRLQYHLIGYKGLAARWDRCTPIGWRLKKGGPKGAAKRVKEALRRTSAVTGLKFVYRGTTSAMPAKGRFPAAVPDDTLLIVGWATEKQVPGLRGGTVGLGGPSYDDGWNGPGTAPQIHKGQVLIDLETERKLRPGFGPMSSGSVLLHEIGHAVGLEHVTSPAEVMSPYVSPYNSGTWGKGDKRGLRKLYAIGCFPPKPAEPDFPDFPDIPEPGPGGYDPPQPGDEGKCIINGQPVAYRYCAGGA